VDVTAWQKTAEVVCQYVKKGHQLYVEGRLKMDSWETPQGHRQTKLKVVAERVEFLEPRAQEGAPPPQRAPGQPQSQAQQMGLAGSDLPF
jgi:single-strand DNA-binding protein